MEENGEHGGRRTKSRKRKISRKKIRRRRRQKREIRHGKEK